MAENTTPKPKRVRFSATSTVATIITPSARLPGGSNNSTSTLAISSQVAILPAEPDPPDDELPPSPTLSQATPQAWHSSDRQGEESSEEEGPPVVPAPPNSPDSVSSASSWGTITPPPEGNAVRTLEAIQSDSSVTPALLQAFSTVGLSLQDGIVGINQDDILLRRYAMGPPAFDGELTFAIDGFPFRLRVVCRATTKIKDVYHSLQGQLLGDIPENEWELADSEQKTIGTRMASDAGRRSDRIKRSDLLGRHLKDCVIAKITATKSSLHFMIVMSPSC